MRKSMLKSLVLSAIAAGSLLMVSPADAAVQDAVPEFPGGRGRYDSVESHNNTPFLS